MWQSIDKESEIPIPQISSREPPLKIRSKNVFQIYGRQQYKINMD